MEKQNNEYLHNINCQNFNLLTVLQIDIKTINTNN